MIRRKRVDPRRELSTAARGQLIGVELGPQPEGGGGAQNALGLVDPKSRIFDEDVAAARQAFPGNSRDDSLNQQLDVRVSALAKLWRHHVGTEESGHQTDRLLPSKLAVDPKQLELRFLIHAIPTLAFDGGHAEGKHLFQEAAGAAQQIGFSRTASEPHRGENPAAVSGDLQIGPALNPLHELVGSPAGEREMRVAVDQPRNDQAAVGVDLLRGAILGWKVS